MFDKGFIEQNSDGVVHGGTTNATTLFSTSATIQALIPRMKIGKLSIRKYTAVALDLEAVNAAYHALGHPRVVAIIGSDIFHRYEAKISYKKLKVYFFRINHFPGSIHLQPFGV